MLGRFNAVVFSLLYVFIYYMLRPIDCLYFMLVKGFPYTYWPFLWELLVTRWGEMEGSKMDMKQGIKDYWEGV